MAENWAEECTEDEKQVEQRKEGQRSVTTKVEDENWVKLHEEMRNCEDSGLIEKIEGKLTEKGTTDGN